MEGDSMSRLTIHDALTVARDPAAASPLALIEAKRTLRNARADADQALAALVCEMRRRSAFDLHGTTYAVPMPEAAE
jgi:hypothetical protein